MTTNSHNLFYPPKSRHSDLYHQWTEFLVQDDGSVRVWSHVWIQAEWSTQAEWTQPGSQVLSKEEARGLWIRLRKDGWEMCHVMSLMAP
jgi:hypothetical protein